MPVHFVQAFFCIFSQTAVHAFDINELCLQYFY